MRISVSVRDLSETDVPRVLDYWFRSPPGYLEAMGVDLAKMPQETEMEARLREGVQANQTRRVSKSAGLTIVCNGQPVGTHVLNPVVEGDHGIFHAHIWEPAFRRRGIGLQSYPKASRIYFERFDLKRILFKTPVQNIGAIRVKEKLGIRQIGEEKIGFSIIRDGTLARVFELTREEALRNWP